MGETDLSNVITFNPQVVGEKTSLAELLRQWGEVDYHHWPVADGELRLLGIISVNDIDRAVLQLAAAYPNDFRLGAEQLHTRTAGEIMSRPVVLISRWDTQANGLNMMLQNRIHSLPVMDEGHLVGLVTTTDFLREFSYGDLPVSRQTVSEFAESTLDPVDCEMSLDEVAAAMSSAGVEQIGVVNGDLPLGVITRLDVRLAKCRLEIRRFLSDEFVLNGPTTMRELATQSPTVRPGARLSEAAGLLVEHRRQAIAVVTHAGRMVGVLSDETLLTAMAGEKAKQTLASV